MIFTEPDFKLNIYIYIFFFFQDNIVPWSYFTFYS